MSDPSWKDVNWWEFAGSVGVSLGVGMIRLLVFIRERRRFRWVDILVEPLTAVFAGSLVWLFLEHVKAPELLQMGMVSLGAWGGPRTVHMLEVKYFGGSRHAD
jgi:LydA holin phage, holin superfamily III